MKLPLQASLTPAIIGRDAPAPLAGMLREQLRADQVMTVGEDGRAHGDFVANHAPCRMPPAIHARLDLLNDHS